MGGIFDINGKFYTTLSKITDFIILALLLEIFCIPIFTAGPAICGVFYVGMREVRDEEGYVWKGFWKSFKQNFKQGAILSLILAGIGAFMSLDIYWAYQIFRMYGSIWYQMILFVIIGLTFVFFSISLYVFPLLSKFYNTNRQILRNSVIISAKHVPTTLAMAGMLIAIVVLSLFWNPLVFFIGVPIFLWFACWRMNAIVQQTIDEMEENAKEGKEGAEESGDGEGTDALPENGAVTNASTGEPGAANGAKTAQAGDEDSDYLPSGTRKPEVILAGRPYTKLSKQEKAEYDLAVEEQLNYAADNMPTSITDALKMKEEQSEGQNGDGDANAETQQTDAAGETEETEEKSTDAPKAE